eukprot:TRINITY_DN6000_c0_g1_i6.p1 TRINITY_DN6000_c0_g1~~TRINITY_DN6000_c0_g1_i6.p1  ORF type:complete len:829 (+),score=161.24 TRINITY_DN6000_c0_g1_i6:51-2537(+)
MIVRVNVRGETFSIQCSKGNQPLRWLGFIACQRYAMQKAHLHQSQFVPLGVMMQNGVVIDPSRTIAECFKDNEQLSVEIGEGTRAFTIPWEGRSPSPPLFEEETVLEETKLEPQKKEVGPDVGWIKKFDFKKFAIDKMLLGDMRKMTDLEVNDFARGFFMDAMPMAVHPLKAVRDYAASRPDQLNFRKGDMVTIIENVDATWWRGELNGKIGVFPAACLELEQVIANRDFVGTKPEELHFVRGDIITILDRSDPNWWRGEVNGRSGVFPRTFVTMVLRAENGELDSGTKVLAIRDAPAIHQDEISIAKCDIISVLDFARDDKWKGIVNGVVGYFNPKNVTMLQDAGMGAVKARRDFPGSKPGELPFKRGDRIIVLEQPSTDIWKGMVNGRVGNLPASYVDMEQYVAVGTHQAIRPEDLAFPENAVITVLEKSNLQRWRGEFMDNYGYFPAHLVKRAEQYVSGRDYRATRAEEISFKKGDIITILRKDDPEFLLASVMNIVGFIPRAYVPISDLNEKDASTDVISIREYKATTPEELSFPKFAIIMLLEKDGRTHWKGQYEGQIGTFPKGIVEPILGQRLQDSALSNFFKDRKVFTREEVIDYEFTAVKTFFLERAAYTKNLFSYYSAVNIVGYADVDTMSSAQFISFAKECKLLGPQLRPVDLDIIFVAAHPKTGDPSTQKKESEKTMSPQEFLSALLRIAHLRYRTLPRLSARLKELFDGDITPNAMGSLQEFAKKVKIIHAPQIKEVMEKHMSRLNRLFQALLADDRTNTGKVTFHMFLQFAKAWDLIGTDKLSIFIIRLIFMYSTSAAEGATEINFNDSASEVLN